MVLELLMPDNDCDVWNNDNDSDDDDEDKTETIAIRMREEGSAIVPIRKWAGFMTATEQSVQMLTRKNWRKKNGCRVQEWPLDLQSSTLANWQKPSAPRTYTFMTRRSYLHNTLTNKLLFKKNIYII